MNGTLASASSIVHVSQQGSQAELMRENLRQMAIVTARLEGRDLGSAVGEIRQLLAGKKLPVGYTWEVGGQDQSQREAFRQLLMVSGVATALVFVVLVIQFRRFTQAALILAAAPLSLGGAFALLMATGTDLNVSAAMGLILLVGLVVKNGIVLLDFAERRLAEGQSIRNGCADRRTRASAADSDDDAVYALWPVAAGTRTRRGSGVAEASGARGHRRAKPVDARDAVPGAGGIRRLAPDPRLTASTT